VASGTRALKAADELRNRERVVQEQAQARARGTLRNARTTVIVILLVYFVVAAIAAVVILQEREPCGTPWEDCSPPSSRSGLLRASFPKAVMRWRGRVR